MKFKISLLAALLVAAFPLAAKAQDTNSYESLKVSCESGAECSDFGVNFQEEGDKVAQTRRTRTRRTRSNDVDSKYYVGGNVGLFLPFFDADNEGIIDYDPGFTFGGFAGYRFTENISAELEVYDSLGGSEIDDFGYNVFAASANGVYRYYFNPDNDRSLYVYGGLGLGVGIFNPTGDEADGLDSQTGFLLQTKAGVGYPVAEKIDLFGQARFTNVFLGEDEDEGFDGEDANGLSFDVGATYKF